MHKKILKITDKELSALRMALEYVGNLTERCTASEKSQSLKDLRFTTKYGYKLFNKLKQFNH